MGERSEEDGHKNGDRGLCPVRSSTEDASVGASGSPTVGVGSEVASESSSQSNGLWSFILSWIPFGSVGEDVAVQHQNLNEADAEVSSSPGGGLAMGCPVQQAGIGTITGEASKVAEESLGCPVKHDGETSSGSVLKHRAFNVRNNEFVYGQRQVPGQSIPLSTSRQTSSIPKGDHNPSHQPQGVADKWVYPSEQQYYNAIKRKGHKADAVDMPTTLAIHNAVNERGWAMVTKWERLRAGADDSPPPKLLRFEGRPQDMSPKAWVKTYLLGYQAPFDRHDWVIQRPDGSTARYVIDFYSGHIKPGSGVPVALHLDVRPALDSVEAVVDRSRMLVKEAHPYLSGILDAFKSGADSGSPDAASREDAPPPSQSAPAGR